MLKRLLFLLSFLFLGTVLLAAEKTVNGSIAEVDPKKNCITVGELTLDVTRKTKIIIDGKKSTFSDIKKGQKVTIVYDDELEIANSIKTNDTNGGPSDAASEIKKFQGNWLCVAA